MKIMLVTMDYPPPMGGIQVVTKNLEEDLLAAGHKVYLLNFDGRNINNFQKLKQSDFFYTDATRNDYYKLGNLLNPLKLFDPSGYRDFVYTNLIFRETKRARADFKPDITHILKPTLYSAIYDVKEPVIVSCHGEEVQDSFPVSYCLSRASFVHCVSHYSKRLVKRIQPDLINIEVIHNSVDLDGIENVKTESKEPMIVSCCRLAKRKNIDGLLRAFALLPKAIATNYSFVIIGDGPEKSSLVELANNLGLCNVIFVGQIGDNEKREYLCRSKLFVLCPVPYRSTFEGNEEGFGISYIEAQAAGLPIVGSNIGGIPEAVGDAGILVQNPEDPQEIASCIQQLLLDKDLYTNLQDSALSRVKNFDRKLIFKQFLRLYQKALNYDNE
jgi:glycosyltransferase involved in cell wall biosynthesis